MAKYEVSAVDELVPVIGAAAARKLRRAVEGKLNLSPGRLARVAEGLSVMSARAKERATGTVVLDQGRAIDCGVVFAFRKAYTTENPDVKAMKVLLPRKDHPELYSDSEVKATITVSVGPPPQDG